MKLFGKGGKLNVIDIILILILVAALVFAVASFAISSAKEEAAKNIGDESSAAQKLRFVAVCEEVDELLANGIINSFENKSDLYGDETLSMTRLYNNYHLIDAEIVAWEYKDGNLYITIESDVQYENGSLVVGVQEVRIGNSFKIKTLGVEIESVVYTAEKIDD